MSRVVAVLRRPWLTTLIALGAIVIAAIAALLFGWGHPSQTLDGVIRAVVEHEYCGLPGAGGPLAITVLGTVVDETGAPVPNCEARVSLGLDMDGPAVATDGAGRFEAKCTGWGWGKGAPTLVVSSASHEPWHTNYRCWYRGSRQFNTQVVLKGKAPRSSTTLVAADSPPLSRRFILPANTLAGGRAAEVTLTQVADKADRPVRCGLTVVVDGEAVFSHEQNVDWNFADPGLMAGWKCEGYGACRLAWLDAMRDRTVQTIDARSGGAWHFLLESRGSHRAAAIATADLEKNLHVPADSAKRAVSYIVATLASGPVQVLVTAGSPATDGVTRIYVPELKRFVKIFEP